MSTTDATKVLDDLLDSLATAADGSRPDPVRRPDAIDAVLAAPPRTSRVRSLRDSPVVAQFRQELLDGLIRADAARRLLALIAEVVKRLP